MSVYHTSFNYLNKNSNQDFGLIVSHFADGADSGETETFMSMEPVYTDNAFGTKRIDYGAKYSSVAVFRITVIKQDGSELSVSNIRTYLKWLTGARFNSSLDLLIGNEVKYAFVGRFTNAWQYKMDAKTCGLVLEFTSISPWAYSPIQTITQSIDGTTEIQIDNQSDDLYEYVYPKIVYKNTTGNSLTIENTTTGEITKIDGLSDNETITIDNNLMIISDKPSKTFGNTFNFIFPRFAANINNLVVTGAGDLTIEYIMYLKVGDCARDINVVYDPICSEDGTIQVDTLPWDRVSDTPTTLKGYGISDFDPLLAQKENISAKVSDKRDIIDESVQYPSIEFLRGYYYDINDIDNFLAEKVDASSVYSKNSIDLMLNNKADKLMASLVLDSNYVILQTSTSTSLSAGFSTGISKAKYICVSSIVKRIQGGAFANCENLTDIYINNTEDNVFIESGAIPDGVTVHWHETLNELTVIAITTTHKLNSTAGSVKSTHIDSGAVTLSKLSDEVKALINSGGGEGGGSTYVEIDEQELNNMLAEVLGEQN